MCIKTSEYGAQFLFAAFSILPQGVSIAIREFFASESVEFIKKILKYLCAEQKNKSIGSPNPKIRQILNEFKLVKNYFECVFSGGNPSLIDNLFGTCHASETICRQLFAAFETILVCLYDRG